MFCARRVVMVRQVVRQMARQVIWRTIRRMVCLPNMVRQHSLPALLQLYWSQGVYRHHSRATLNLSRYFLTETFAFNPACSALNVPAIIFALYSVFTAILTPTKGMAAVTHRSLYISAFVYHDPYKDTTIQITYSDLGTTLKSQNTVLF